MRLRLLLAACAAAALAATVALSVGVGASAHNTTFRLTSSLKGIHKIKHVVVILQENRSFDSYFGTYPGADGIPKGVCVPDPHNGGCVTPYVDHANSN